MPLTKGQILKEIDDWLGEMDNCLLVINGLLYNIWANARRIEHGVDEVETAMLFCFGGLKWKTKMN